MNVSKHVLNLVGWRPIETAPDDDTPVLIWNMYDNVVVGRRISKNQWMYADGDDDSRPNAIQGHAWMPIPDKPYYTVDGEKL